MSEFGYVVVRLQAARWTPISRVFPTSEQAHRYQAELPKDWRTEVREVGA